MFWVLDDGLKGETEIEILGIDLVGVVLRKSHWLKNHWILPSRAQLNLD